MTIRSMPPASSHFADRPVPAPPPMIGMRRRFMSWNFSKSAPLSKPDISNPPVSSRHDRAENLDHAIGKDAVVDIAVHPFDPARRRGLDRPLYRAEQSLVGVGIPEGFARRVQGGHATDRQQETNRPV